MCAEVVCTNVFFFEWSSISVCFSLCWTGGGKKEEKKRNVAPMLPPTDLSPPPSPPCSKTLSENLLTVKKPNPGSITLHCHGHVLLRPLHCFAPTDFFFQIPLVVLSKHQREKKKSDYPAVDFNWQSYRIKIIILFLHTGNKCLCYANSSWHRPHPKTWQTRLGSKLFNLWMQAPARSSQSTDTVRLHPFKTNKPTEVLQRGRLWK